MNTNGEDPFTTLETRIGYRFNDRALLVNALTHSSSGTCNYERLEFLGDRVLNLIMADELYHRFPEEKEGDLAKRHAALVQGKMLADIARTLELGAVMQFSDAERAAGGAENENILGDAVESLLGALYIDAGLDQCRRIVAELWGDAVNIMLTPPRDPKTGLQEWAQARGLPLPAYALVGQTGPDHAPVFEIQVTVEGYPPALATGSSRRRAEKDAAAALLAILEHDEVKSL